MKEGKKEESPITEIKKIQLNPLLKHQLKVKKKLIFMMLLMTQLKIKLKKNQILKI